MSERIFKNARIVTGDAVVTGHLRVVDGLIADIAEGPCGLSAAKDLEGDWLLPGLVEVHTDNLERHIEPRPKVDWPHAAAIIAHDGELASVGITTVFDALRVGSVTSKAKGNYGEYARVLADEVARFRLPNDAAFTLFALARSVGLLAHAIEQLGSKVIH